MGLPPVPQKREGRIMGKLQFSALDSSTKRPNTSSGTAAVTLASVDVVLVGGDRRRVHRQVSLDMPGA